MLYATNGGTEATAFGVTSSDVPVKENMAMLNKVESGGSIRLNNSLWILKWELIGVQEKSSTRKEMCVSVCE